MQSIFDACVAFAEGKTTKPVLPRHRRFVVRLYNGTPAHGFTSVKECYRKDFFEACDLLVGELNRRLI